MLSSQILGFIAINVGFARSSALSYPRDSHQSRAAYFLDNDPAGNSIVALQISNSHGTLSNPVRTSTGGKGLTGLIALSQDGVVVDDDVSLLTSASTNILENKAGNVVPLQRQRRRRYLLSFHNQQQ